MTFFGRIRIHNSAVKTQCSYLHVDTVLDGVLGSGQLLVGPEKFMINRPGDGGQHYRDKKTIQ